MQSYRLKCENPIHSIEEYERDDDRPLALARVFTLLAQAMATNLPVSLERRRSRGRPKLDDDRCRERGKRPRGETTYRYF